MNEIPIQILFTVFAAAFVTTMVVVPFLIYNSKKAGIVGKDKNKNGELVPEMGGIAIVAGISIGILAAITLILNTAPDIRNLLAALCTVLIMGILGVLDDLYELKQKVKAPIPFIASIPLSAVRAGPSRIVQIPFISGGINFGSLYPLAIVPLGVGGASNAFNMLAGLNGLEAGMGLVISLAVFIAAYIKGSADAMIISIALFGACFAFLFFNRFPAKIFPGDVGTYTIGGTIASAVIVGNLEFFGLVLFLPYFVEFILKAKNKFRGQNYGELKNGRLVAPEKPESLTHYFMKMGKFSEGQVVSRMLLMEVVIAAFALMFFVK